MDQHSNFRQGVRVRELVKILLECEFTTTCGVVNWRSWLYAVTKPV